MDYLFIQARAKQQQSPTVQQQQRKLVLVRNVHEHTRGGSVGFRTSLIGNQGRVVDADECPELAILGLTG